MNNFKKYLIGIIIGLSFVGTVAYAGIPISSNFTPQFTLPLDDRITATSTVARDAIDSGRRYPGLLVFVSSTSQNYQLQGGTANSNWVLLTNGNIFNQWLDTTSSPSFYDLTTTNGITLGGVFRNTWPVGGGGGGGSFWVTSSNSLVGYPGLVGNYSIVIGAAATTTNDRFEVNGLAKVSSLIIGTLQGLLYGSNGSVGTIATSSLGLPQFSDLSGYVTQAYGSSTYYLATNPSGYITATALNPYLLQSVASSSFPTFAYASTTYYLATNPAGYITNSALAPYSTQAYNSSTFLTLLGWYSTSSQFLTTTTAALTYQPIGNYLTTSTGLTVANFASPNISQWTNDAGYITSAGTSTDLFWSDNGAQLVATDTRGIIVNGTSTFGDTATFNNINDAYDDSVKVGPFDVGGGNYIPVIQFTSNNPFMSSAFGPGLGIISNKIFISNQDANQTAGILFQNADSASNPLTIYTTSSDDALNFSGATSYNFDNNTEITNGNDTWTTSINKGFNYGKAFNISYSAPGALYPGDYLSFDSNLKTVELGYGANVDSQDSLAIGNFTSVSGLQSSAIGYLAISDGLGSTAIGHNIQASASYSTAIGNNNIASSSYATAVGSNSTAEGYGCTAIGNDAHCYSSFGLALGSSVYSHGQSSVAIGENAYTDSNYAVAIGHNASSTADSAFALGDISVYGHNSFGIGFGNSSSVTNNVSTPNVMSLMGGNVGIGTTTPKSTLTVTGGDVYITSSTRGIIMTSPNGSCYRTTVSDIGLISTNSITCP